MPTSTDPADPAECADYWERHYARACAHVLRLADLDLDDDDPRVTQAWDQARALLRNAQRQRLAAQHKLAIHSEWNLTSNPPMIRPRVSTPRRRERRPAARATPADSGDADPPPPRPAHDLAVCPCCSDEDIARAACTLCGELGFIARERRNRWKRGQR